MKKAVLDFFQRNGLRPGLLSARNKNRCYDCVLFLTGHDFSAQVCVRVWERMRESVRACVCACVCVCAHVGVGVGVRLRVQVCMCVTEREKERGCLVCVRQEFLRKSLFD